MAPYALAMLRLSCTYLSTTSDRIATAARGSPRVGLEPRGNLGGVRLVSVVEVRRDAG